MHPCALKQVQIGEVDDDCGELDLCDRGGLPFAFDLRYSGHAVHAETHSTVFMWRSVAKKRPQRGVDVCPLAVSVVCSLLTKDGVIGLPAWPFVLVSHIDDYR